jgi:hypothetical protein
LNANSTHLTNNLFVTWPIASSSIVAQVQNTSFVFSVSVTDNANVYYFLLKYFKTFDVLR